MPVRIRTLAVLLFTCFGTSAASAQPLGTFRWQQSPYCNVITVNAVHSGGVYQLDGIDDQCGAPTQAAVVGIAFLNPDGTLGLGLTLVTSPGGIPLHLDAAISVASGHGTWRDSAGAAGDFVLTAGAGTGGPARPVPRVSFAGGLSGAGATIINVAPPVADTDAATKGYVDGATANVRAALIGEKVLKASVNADGTRSGTGPFTSSTFGTGSYSVTFDVTGMGLPLQFGLAAATPLFCPGASAVITNKTTLSTAGVLTHLGMGLSITDAAGSAADCAFDLLVTMPDADPPGSPVSPLGSGGLPGVACSTAGAVTTCVARPAP